MRDGRLQAVDWDEHAAGEVKRSGHADIVTGGRRAAIGQLDHIRPWVFNRLSYRELAATPLIASSG